MAFPLLQSAIQMVIPTKWSRSREHDTSGPRDDQLQFQDTANAALMLKLNRPSACTLHKFPPEIREMVYKNCLWLEPIGATPSLLVALRGDWTLYEEALQWFYAHNWFRLSKHTFEIFQKELSVDRVGLIQNLSLKLDPKTLHRRDRNCHLRKHWEFQTFLCDFLSGKESKLGLASNVKSLAVQFMTTKEHKEAARWIVDKYLEEPGRLKTLELRTITACNGLLTVNAGEAVLRKDIDRLLGIAGKCLGQTGRDRGRLVERWIWKESSGVLKAVAGKADVLTTKLT